MVLIKIPRTMGVFHRDLVTELRFHLEDRFKIRKFLSHSREHGEKAHETLSDDTVHKPLLMSDMLLKIREAKAASDKAKLDS